LPSVPRGPQHKDDRSCVGDGCATKEHKTSDH
jgi:hypothetical protein